MAEENENKTTETPSVEDIDQAIANINGSKEDKKDNQREYEDSEDAKLVNWDEDDGFDGETIDMEMDY